VKLNVNTWMGFRTFIGGIFAISALTLGMYLVEAGDRSDAFLAFAGGVVGVMGTLAGKSAISSLSNGSGIRGAMNSLMTDAKPGSPAPPKKSETKSAPPQENG
jgi:hypothetical protein